MQSSPSNTKHPLVDKPRCTRTILTRPRRCKRLPSTLHLERPFRTSGNPLKLSKSRVQNYSPCLSIWISIITIKGIVNKVRNNFKKHLLQLLAIMVHKLRTFLETWFKSAKSKKIVRLAREQMIWPPACRKPSRWGTSGTSRGVPLARLLLLSLCGQQVSWCNLKIQGAQSATIWIGKARYRISELTQETSSMPR